MTLPPLDLTAWKANMANDANQPDWTYMRETAYALNTHLNTPLQRDMARIEQLKNMLLYQLDQSFVSFKPFLTPGLYRKPFMVALAAQALIQYYQEIHTD